jgi:hypothetical protein
MIRNPLVETFTSEVIARFHDSSSTINTSNVKCSTGESGNLERSILYYLCEICVLPVPSGYSLATSCGEVYILELQRLLKVQCPATLAIMLSKSANSMPLNRLLLNVRRLLDLRMFNFWLNSHCLLLDVHRLLDLRFFNFWLISHHHLKLYEFASTLYRFISTLLKFCHALAVCSILFLRMGHPPWHLDIVH